MPITVGALQNVPAPGDPITSPWAQQASGFVVHPFATIAAINAGWPAAPNGSVAIALDTAIIYVRRANLWRPIPNTVLFAGTAQGPNNPRTTTGIVDLVAIDGGTYPYPTTVAAVGMMYAGFGIGQTNFSGDMWANGPAGAVSTSGSTMSAIAGAYNSMPLNGVWTCAANVTTSAKLRLNVLATAGGNVHNVSQINLTVYAG